MQKDSGWSGGKMRWRFRAADLCTRHKSLSATRKSIHTVFKGNSPIVICLNLQSLSPTFISSVARTTGLWSLKRVKKTQQKQLQLPALFDVSSIFSLFQFGLSCVAHFTKSLTLISTTHTESSAPPNIRWPAKALFISLWAVHILLFCLSSHDRQVAITCFHQRQFSPDLFFTLRWCYFHLRSGTWCNLTVSGKWEAEVRHCL